MSSLITIKGNVRTELKKNECRRVRRNGKLPAILHHNSKKDQTTITIDPKWLSFAWKNGKVFNLEMDGKAKPVKITELQFNPVKRSPIHVDLKYK